MVTRRDKFPVAFVYFGLALATVAAFWQVHNFDFVNYDDPVYVTENEDVQAGLTRQGIRWAFSTGRAANWHPVTWLSHMLDCQLFGPSQAGRHHLTSLLLHVANTLLLFAVFREMTGGLWRSAFVAAAFALHPLHVQSVAWIAERKDVLSTLFWILTMAAYVAYVRRGKGGWYLLTLLVFAVGLMAKPMLVTLPFVLLLLDYWPLERFEVKTAVESGQRRTGKSEGERFQWRILFGLAREKVPFFALSAVSSVVTLLVQRSGGAIVTLEYIPLRLRIANALVCYVRYIGKMVWPRRLAVFYRDVPGSLSTWKVAAAALLLLVIAVCAIRMGRKCRYLPVGWLWYLGTLLPVIGLIQVGEQSMADRYTYVPLTGLFIIIAWGVNDLAAKWQYRKVVLGVSAGTILCGLSICTHLEVRYWRNSIALFERAVELSGNDKWVYGHLAKALAEAGRVDEAVVYLKEVVQAMPRRANLVNNLAWLLATHKETEFYNPEEAIRLAKRACQLTNYERPGLLDTLAAAYAAAGRFDEAVETAEKALTMAEAMEKKKLAVEFRARLGLYRAGKPYTEKWENQQKIGGSGGG